MHSLHPQDGQRSGHRPAARRICLIHLRRQHFRRASQHSRHAAIGMHRHGRLSHGQERSGTGSPRLGHHVFGTRWPHFLRGTRTRSAHPRRPFREIRRPAGNLRPHLHGPCLPHQPLRRQSRQGYHDGGGRSLPSHHRQRSADRRDALYLRQPESRFRHRPHARSCGRLPPRRTVLPRL